MSQETKTTIEEIKKNPGNNEEPNQETTKEENNNKTANEETTNNETWVNKSGNKRGINNKDSNHSNLTPFNRMSVERQKEIASLGGKRNGEINKKKRDAQSLMIGILNRQMTTDQIQEILGGSADLIGEDKSVYNVLLVKMLQVAMSGNTTALAMVRDTAGDKPIERQEISNTIITDEDRQLIDNVRKRLLG